VESAELHVAQSSEPEITPSLQLDADDDDDDDDEHTGFVPVGIGTLYLEDLGILQVGSSAGLDASSSNHFVPCSSNVP
jgi:hypothetical protein